MNDFERWWYQEGSAFRPVDEDVEEFAKRMCQIAWSNGAFKEREAIKNICKTEQTEDSADLWNVCIAHLINKINKRNV